MRRLRRRSVNMIGGLQKALFGIAVVAVALPMIAIFYLNVDSFRVSSDPEIEYLRRDTPRMKKLLSIIDRAAEETNTAKRYQTSQEYCKHHDTKTIKPESFKHIIVNDKYKILYCQIPKVACTNWRRIMLILTGKMNTTLPMELKAADVHKDYDKYLTYLSDLPVDEIKVRLETYYKFIFTREPFERILSAYRNKFKGKNPFFHQRYGKNIVKRYRANSEGSKPSGNDVTFSEFAHYLTDYTRKEPLNEHWERMAELCHPCLVKYDLVSSYDDLETNSDRLLKKIGVANSVKFPKRSQSYKHKGTEELLREYYRQIPPAVLDQLMEVYYSDFLIFKYKIPKSLRNLTKWQVKL